MLPRLWLIEKKINYHTIFENDSRLFKCDKEVYGISFKTSRLSFEQIALFGESIFIRVILFKLTYRIHVDPYLQ